MCERPRLVDCSVSIRVPSGTTLSFNGELPEIVCDALRTQGFWSVIALKVGNRTFTITITGEDHDSVEWFTSLIANILAALASGDGEAEPAGGAA